MIVLIAVGAVAAVPEWRAHERDAVALVLIKSDGLGRQAALVHPPIPIASQDNPYRHLRAHGRARTLLATARTQLGMPYVYGAQPRHQWAVSRIGSKPNRAGFDCSSYVAWAFQQGLHVWISGSVAHTDEIWTQGGAMPLTTTAGETSLVVRGTGAVPPPRGYRPGDILFRRQGAGGYWGHVAIVGERGFVIEAFPPDVHETREITEFLADGDALGWMRLT